MKDKKKAVEQLNYIGKFNKKGIIKVEDLKDI
jgi:hypothetical protein